MKKKLISYFYGSIGFTIVAILFSAIFFGYIPSKGNILAALNVAFIVIVLGVLEVSLSFDNAVVNAVVLKKMSAFWRKMFITVGIIIAVFGMRIIFPLIIVSICGQMNPGEAFSLALVNPQKYSEILTSSEVLIAGFGGSFLLLVALNYFINVEKDVHWIHAVEKRLTKIDSMKSAEIIITLLIFITLIFSGLIKHEESLSFLIAGVLGIITHEIIDGVKHLLEVRQKAGIGNIAKAGFASFLYLEVLDASFSFDGVIGAFVISKDIFIIALGLGIGAMFVRSLTILMVEKNTLAQFIYLEHGAFWSITVLAIIILISPFFKIPEAATAAISIAFIGLSLLSSVKHDKKQSKKKSVKKRAKK